MVKDNTCYNMKGIVVTTSKYTKDFLKDCLDSIKGTEYNILVVSNDSYKPDIDFSADKRIKPTTSLIINNWNGWELAGIQRGKETFSEFVHLMDTTLIKDISLFDKLFAIEGNVVLTKGNFHYMGKFDSKRLPNLPRVHNKDIAIFLETRWLPEYTEFTPDLPVHTTIFEEKHGQRRMKLENDYLIKWKGTFYT